MSLFNTLRMLMLTVSLAVVGVAAYGHRAVAAGSVKRDPTIQKAIDRGAAFIKGNGTSFAVPRGWESISALALVKADVPPNDPAVAGAVAKVRAKIQYDAYVPLDKSKHIYEAGVDLMLLAETEPGLYQTEMEHIVEYLVSHQFPDGSWDYPKDGIDPQIADVGDTSISQYALLGLWAADRSGISVPLEVWDRAAQWHVKTQRGDGSFSYHPGGRVDTGPTHSMTAAGTGSLLITRLHLQRGPTAKSTPENKPSAKLGFLEKVDLDVEARKRISASASSDYHAKMSIDKLDASAKGGVDWISKRFTVIKPSGDWHLYYMYGLERMAALADVDELGGEDWYRTGAAYLVKAQLANGSWQDKAAPSIDTAFAVLFLTESTGSTLGKRRGVIKIGAGLLAGGRGLPENLDQVQVQDGKIKERKLAGPVDELLAALEKPDSLMVAEAQTALVEQVQIGDREALIGQLDRLTKLLDDPRPDVRRTAAWALGRSDNLRTARNLIDVLREESDVDVLVEARNALCALSRKPRGLGLPDTPLAGLPEDADDQQRAPAIEKWRKQAIDKWHNWYLSVRPYDEQDDLDQSRK